MFEITIGDLLLRPIEEGDAPRFVELISGDELIARNTARIPLGYTLEDANQFVARVVASVAAGDEFPFAVCRAGEIIACAGAQHMGEGVHEIGYWAGAPYRGAGVASAAARAVTQFAFVERGAEMVTAGHFIDNPASGRVLEKAGLQPTGETKHVFSLGRGEEAQTRRFALARADFALRDDIVIRRLGA